MTQPVKEEDVKMQQPVRIEIDGRTIDVERGRNVLTVARENGVDIPGLCFHPRLSMTGGCRLCVVKIEGRGGLTPACTLDAVEGLSLVAFDDELEAIRASLVDLFLAEHNCDCLVCNSAGACELQDLAYRYGLDRRTRKFTPTRDDLPEEDASSPVLIQDPSKCILCERCIKACDEIQGKEILSYAHRGLDTVVTASLEGWGSSTCDGCGECVQLCPTGAIREKLDAQPPRRWEMEPVQTTCSYCGVGCQLDLWVHNGRIVNITGSDVVPNFGSTCVKGRFGHTYLQASDRLTHPLIKRDGEFVETTWGEALDEVAKRLTAIKSEHGPDSIAGLSSATCTNEENYVFQKFMRACVGTNNVDHCARLCHASTVAGLAAAFGSGAMTNSIEEIEFADCILVTGSNTTETHPIIANLIKRAVRYHGAKLIVIDPRRIDLVRHASLWLRQRNGTDVAWINGLMHVILSEGLHDEAFITDRTENFDAFQEVVDAYPPGRASEISGIPVSALVEAARVFASSGSSAIVYSMGITQHTHGTDNVLSLANLAMLTGHIGKPSSGVNPLRGQNNVQGACDLGALPNVCPGYQAVTAPETRARFEEAWGSKISPAVGLTIVEMMHAAHDETLKGMVIMGENPMVSDPNLNHVEKALKALDFLVVQDVFLTETAQLADVVLPAASFAETDGTFTNTERRVLLVNKAIDPPGEARQDWKIIGDLSTRMGYPTSYANAAEIMDEIAEVTPIYGGISHRRLREGELQWPCPSSDHPGTKFLHEGRFSRGLGRFHPVEYVPSAELPNDEYPFVLSTGRILHHFHTGSMSRRSEALNAYENEGYIEIHPADLAKLGLSNGDSIKVITRRGSIVTTARETERVAVGSIFAPFHFVEAAANRLTNDALDPKAKIPEFKVAACRLERPT
ncbi:formate dehydrogenase subunit alpha [Candidatus Bipolaricaulota bacterium]